MRALCVVLTLLLVASVAVADEKAKLDGVQFPPTSRALDCANAVPIACGQTMTGDNTGMPNNVVNYSCTTLNENGGEVVYELVLPAPACQEVTITMTPSGCDLDLFFLGSCDETDCIDYSGSVSTEVITTGCLLPGTYYIVVDGYGSAVPGAECPFTIQVECNECDCPQPDCCPFPFVCYEVDFNLDDGGFVTLPCGGAPVWQWGTPPEIPPIACDDVPMTHVLGTIIGGDYPASGGEIAMVGPFFIDEFCTCLELCHYYDTEPSYDGANLKISTDGGITWTLATPNRGYDQNTNASPLCIPSEPAFSGHQFQNAFLRDCFNISQYVGQTIWVGFFWGNDSSIQYPGWYIKWLKIGGQEGTSTEDSSWGSIKALYR